MVFKLFSLQTHQYHKHIRIRNTIQSLQQQFILNHHMFDPNLIINNRSKLSSLF